MNEEHDLETRLAQASKMFPQQWKEGYEQRIKENRLLSPQWDEIPAGLDLDDPKQLAWWDGYFTAKLEAQPD